MAEHFDPYHVWLGIPSEDQPPNHYRLLGVPLFEENAEAIEQAADQRMGHLRNHQTGKHAALSQKLLNEVAMARVCLLNPDKRAAYDGQLRHQLDAEQSAATPMQPVVSVVPRNEATVHRPHPRNTVSLSSWPILVGAGVAVFLVAGLIIWAMQGSHEEVAQESQTEAAGNDASTRTGVDMDAPTREGSQDVQGLTENTTKGGRSNTPSTAPSSAAPSLPQGATAVDEPTDPDVNTGSLVKETDTGQTPNPPSADADPSTHADSPIGASQQKETRQDSGAEEQPSEQPAPAEPQRDRHLVPPDSVQQSVFAQLNQTFAIDKVRQPAEKLELAGKLASLAGKSKKPEERFVLLRKATELAADGGDAVQMLKLVEQMSEQYDVDPLHARQAMLVRFADAASDEAKVGSLVQVAEPVVDQLVADNRIELADELSATVYRAALRQGNTDLRKTALRHRREVQYLRDVLKQVEEARAALQVDPDDAEAHNTLGRWYALEQGDWEQGLPHLAKGAEKRLKIAAQQDLAFPKEAEAQVALADAWWSAAEEAEDEKKTVLLSRAGYWYQQAQPELSSVLIKTRVAKRLEEIGELGQEVPAPAAETPPLAVAPFDAKQAKDYQLRWAKHLKVPVEWENSIGMKFVLIPPGEFEMGSTKEEVEQLVKEAEKQGAPSWYIKRIPQESPKHRVRITRPFYFGLCEVTQAEYERVVGSNPSRFKGAPDRPVENVTWHDVVQFCHRLSRLPTEKRVGAVYRLPTEAEWEYACRAGTTTRYSFGDDDALLGKHAWWGKNSGEQPQPVGRLKPNAFRLFDMHGNVWERCADWHADDYYAESPVDDPIGPDSGESHVLRGSWSNHDDPGNFRCAYRHNILPDVHDYAKGFRVVLTIEQANVKSAGSSTHSDELPRHVSAPQASDVSDAPPPAVAPFDQKTAHLHQTRWAKHLGVPVLHTNSIGMRLVLIPPGEFLMGSTKQEFAQLTEEAKQDNAPGWYKERLPSETPQHRVRITRPFRLGATDVTQAQYKQVMGNEPSRIEGDLDRPMKEVSWHDAVEFCRRLSEKEDREYRLPTEAEWEYACRAGSPGRRWFSVWPKPLPSPMEEQLLVQCAWFKQNAGGETHPVGQLRANPWGLFDVYGNVWEWCHDWFASDYYAKSPTDDPTGPATGSDRMSRGGGCSYGAESCRSAYRHHGNPTYHGSLGFRVACSVGAADK